MIALRFCVPSGEIRDGEMSIGCVQVMLMYPCRVDLGSSKGYS